MGWIGTRGGSSRGATGVVREGCTRYRPSDCWGTLLRLFLPLAFLLLTGCITAQPRHEGPLVNADGTEVTPP